MMAQEAEKHLDSLIGAAIKSSIDRLILEEVKNAKMRLEQELPRIVSSVALAVMQRVSYERIGNELLIHVKLEK